MGDTLIDGDLTPQRCQRFRAKSGWQFRWTNASPPDGKVIQSGTAEADKWGLVTVQRLKITKAKHRVNVTARP